MAETERVELVERGADARQPVIERMVRSGRAPVIAGSGDGVRELVRDRVPRIVTEPHTPAGQGRLEMADREVSGTCELSQRTQHRGEVVSRPAGVAVRDAPGRVRGEEVAGERDGDARGSPPGERR